MNSVADFYDNDPDREWRRLEQDPYHQLEYVVTTQYLNKYLPPRGRVLDAGGGPGRYSLELCRLGYDVVLLDVSPNSLAYAKSRLESEPRVVKTRMRELAVGDIRDLSRFEKDSFDAVLCLGGPLTHISTRAGRLKAVSELVRVAKPGGILFISVMG